MPSPVRLVVLNYNGGPLTGRCLDHIEALDWPADELEIVVVDNASTDGSAEMVERDHPRTRVIRNDRNTGFPANNLGLTDLGDVRAVGLVNNDGFVQPGWLRALVEALEADEELGAVCARMVFEPRFVDLIIETPTFVPGVGDARQLGVMVSGMRVKGVDVWDKAQFGEGAWGLEQGRGGSFQWTRGFALLRVPVPADAATDPYTGSVSFDVELELEAEATKKVTLMSGAHETRVEVDRTRRWCTARVEGAPYDVIQNAGSMVFEDGAGADRGFLEPDTGQYDEPADVFAWCGGSVLFRPRYVEETGLFDERFFLYYEDTDWSWRGRAQGWRYRYVPQAVMRHVHAATSGEGSPLFAYHVERNRLLMLVKDAPARLAISQIIRFVLVTASYARRDIVGPLLRGSRPNTVTTRRRVTSFLGFTRLVPAMVASRRELRRRRRVPDRELTTWLVRR